jgi:hypothetical protein
MSIGAIATHRTEQVGGREQQIETYQRAQADREVINKEIEAADAKGQSKRADRLRQELRSVNVTLAAGRPATSDAQAETLAWVTRGAVPAPTIGKALPVWLAIAVDIGCTGCFTAIGMVGQKPGRQQEPTVTKRRKVKRSKPRRKAEVVKFPVITNGKVSPTVAANETMH